MYSTQPQEQVTFTCPIQQEGENMSIVSKMSSFNADKKLSNRRNLCNDRSYVASSDRD